MLQQQIWRQYCINAFNTMTRDRAWPFRTYLLPFHNFIQKILQQFTNWYLNDHMLIPFFLATFFLQSRRVSVLSWGPGLQTLGNPCLHHHCRRPSQRQLDIFLRCGDSPWIKLICLNISAAPPSGLLLTPCHPGRLLQVALSIRTPPLLARFKWNEIRRC